MPKDDDNDVEVKTRNVEMEMKMHSFSRFLFLSPYPTVIYILLDFYKNDFNCRNTLCNNLFHDG